MRAGIEGVMRTIGLIGGMSWESTVPYYQHINRIIGEKLGGLHSARLVLHSIDFPDLEILQHEGRWGEAGEMPAGAGAAVGRARAPGRGADPPAAHRRRDGRSRAAARHPSRGSARDEVHDGGDVLPKPP